MLLNYLDTTKIEAPYWFMVELRSEKTSEETIKRIGRSLKAIFQEEPAQVFVPVVERDLDTFVLLTECYVFARADDTAKIAKLRKVTGVQAIMALDDSTRPAKFIKVEDDYVQGLITQCLDNHHKRALEIRAGTWVRIIDGETRDMCGSVISVHGDRVIIKIDMKTKPVMVETDIHNLVDLSHVPEAHRVFYYSAPVREFLEEHGSFAEDQIAKDLIYDEEEMRQFLGQPLDSEEEPMVAAHPAPQNHISREQTPTRLIKGLITEGQRDVHEILRLTVEAIRGGVIKTPKTATILWHVLRQTVIRSMFADDPEVRTYTDVVTKHGKGYELTPKDVLKAIPELSLRSEVGVVTHLAPADLPVGALDTVVGILRRALAAKQYDMLKVVAKIETELKKGRLRAPKHLDSLAQSIRTQILRHFKTVHPGGDIKFLAETYGEAIRVYPTLLKEKFPGLEAVILVKRAIQVKPVTPDVEIIFTNVAPVLPVLHKRRPVTPDVDILLSTTSTHI